MILSESEILLRIARLKSSARNLVPGDDIGAFKSARLAYCGSDSVIEGTHYQATWLTPRDIAYKLFARNWSDFLVKGISPSAAMLNLGLSPGGTEARFLDPFLGELDRQLNSHGITLIGGDTARSAKNIFTLTLMGNRGKFIPRRSKGIRPGDVIVQLGPVGGSELARRLLQKKLACPAATKKFFTRPQVLNDLPGRKYLKATIDQSDSVHKSLSILASMNGAQLSVDIANIRVADQRIRKTSHVLGAAEDLAVFAIADKAILKATRTFQPVGHIESIRVKHPGVVYRRRGKIVSYTGHGFEHFRKG